MNRGGNRQPEGSDCYCFQAIHQESDVVPENVDAIRAIRAILGEADAAESVATNAMDTLSLVNTPFADPLWASTEKP